ncbi:YggT family protein [Dichelobacter nodosus]|uniref:YggT family protein n=1 Tax=Dichelobacter nodosus (strain VCS1703A) TaxID=246195 RepID=A5EV66_DICNV|nr:YggT family protein [Dichelobacter nodosus]ABQ13138.1 conserved hypothetical protein [Dichelobacter nodosus VCS1703A]
MNLVIFAIRCAIAVFIIRFHVNRYHLEYNTVAVQLNRLTEPLTLPFSKMLPKNQRFDWAALIVAAIIAVLGGWVLTSSLLLSLPFGIIFFLCTTWLLVTMYAIFIIVIASWLQVPQQQMFLQVAVVCTQWLMQPLQRLIPSVAGLDFSPIVALFAISFVNTSMMKLLSALFL